MARKDAELAEAEDLVNVWDEDFKKSFKALSPNHRKFLVEYLKADYNASEAYRRVYNKTAQNSVAAVCGSRLLSNVNIRACLEKLKDGDLEDFFLVVNTYRSAARDAYKPVFAKDEDGQPTLVQEIPDHFTRIQAAEKIAKLRAFNKEENDKTDAVASILSAVRARHNQ